MRFRARSLRSARPFGGSSAEPRVPFFDGSAWPPPDSSMSLIAFAPVVAVFVRFIVRLFLPCQSQWPWVGPLCLIRSQSAEAVRNGGQGREVSAARHAGIVSRHRRVRLRSRSALREAPSRLISGFGRFTFQDLSARSSYRA